jgi:F0F1-type ATP synthase assembly protein I
MVSEEHLLIVAHQVPEHDEARRRGVLFWRDPTGDWKASNGEPGKAALGMHLDRFSQSIEKLEADELHAEQTHEFLPILDTLVPIMRTVKNLLAALEEARKAVPKDRALIDIRDRSYDLTRQAELLYEDVKNSMDVAMIRKADVQAKAAQQMAAATHRLNVLAAIFLPIATLGAALGTTLTDNWSWSQNPIGFVIFLIIGVALGAIVASFVNLPTKTNHKSGQE